MVNSRMSSQAQKKKDEMRLQNRAAETVYFISLKKIDFSNPRRRDTLSRKQQRNLFYIDNHEEYTQRVRYVMNNKSLRQLSMFEIYHTLDLKNHLNSIVHVHSGKLEIY